MAQRTPEGGRSHGVELEVPVTCGESQPPSGAFSHSDEADFHTGALSGIFMGRAMWPRTMLPGHSIKGLVCVAGIYQSVAISESAADPGVSGWVGKPSDFSQRPMTAGAVIP